MKLSLVNPPVRVTRLSLTRSASRIRTVRSQGERSTIDSTASGPLSSSHTTALVGSSEKHLTRDV
jgi:hypothetical protein